MLGCIGRGVRRECLLCNVQVEWAKVVGFTLDASNASDANASVNFPVSFANDALMQDLETTFLYALKVP